MGDNQISVMLYGLLIFMVVILMILSIVFLILKMKDNKRKNEKEDIIGKNKGKEEKTKKKVESTIKYNKQSILNFMEFEKIEDNMITVKKGKKYIMVVECQGVNYDLMSRMEKVAVEEGFQQFLNTLRHPIQIYIQTRTINLERSINVYRDRVKEIETQYNQKVFEYNKMINSEVYPQEEINSKKFEVTRLKNLYEYGKDIVRSTEQIHKNRGVLNKKYYISVPYYYEPSSNEKRDLEEIKGLAFSELYTKCQAILRTLTACSVSGKILSSKELVELLYVAYNRDDSEIFGTDKLYESGIDDLYSMSQDVYEKKIKMLDEEIKDRAIDLANEKMEKARSRVQELAEEKEDDLANLIDAMAKMVLDENREYVGTEVATEAIKEIDKDAKEREGGNEDDEIKETQTRGRRKTNA